MADALVGDLSAEGPQPMMGRVSERPRVTVKGEASVRTRPDEARVQLEVFKVDRHSEDAHADVARRSQALDVLLDELEIPRERRTTTGVSVRPEHSWSGSRWERKGWRASNGLVVRLEDAAVVGRLVADAVDRAEATVGGPWWSVSRHTARTEACSEAARQARRKAGAYAQALELRLGEVLEIREPGTGLKDQPAPSAFAAPMVATPAAMTRSGEPTPPGSTSTPARSTCSARSR